MNNENNIIHMSIKYMTMCGINLLGNGTHTLTKFRLDTTLWDTTDPYLRVGLPLVDLVDLLT